MSNIGIALTIKEQFRDKIHSELDEFNQDITKVIEELLNEDKLNNEEIGKLIKVNDVCSCMNCWLDDCDINKENVYKAIINYLSIEDMLSVHDEFEKNSCDYPEDF